MPTYNTSHYKQNYSRYQFYYRQIWKFYQKPSAKVSTALLLTIFTTIFFAIFAIRPTLVTIAELLKTIQDRQEVLTQLERKSSSLATAQQEYLVAADTIDQLDSSLPQDQSLQELIQMIEATAADHQIVIEALNFSQLDIGLETPNDDLSEIPFSLVVTGQYTQLESFIQDVLNLPRYSTLQALSLNAEDGLNPVDATQLDQLELNLRLTAYYQPTY